MPRERTAPPGTWTQQRILAALRDWFETFGETPRSYEWSPQSAELLGVPRARGAAWMHQHPRWPSVTTVCRQFPSWARAIREANLPPARAIAPRRGFADRVEAARRLSRAGYGTAEIAALLDISTRTVRNYLRAGSCRDCGTPVITSERCPRCASRRANQPHWTRKDVVRAFQAWVSEEGTVPTAGDWTPTPDTTRKWAREYPRWPSNVNVRTLFGTWKKGLAAAGLRSRRRRWGRQTIAAAFAEFAAANGRNPKHADLERLDQLPAPATVRTHFGSMQAALEAANLEVPRRRWTRERIIAAILAWAHEHGRLPTSRDWTQSTSTHPHATTVLQQFGRWSAAIEEATGSRSLAGRARR